MPTKLRIDFQIRETCTDGSVSTESLRYVTFGDDVDPGRVKDFFDRCGIATDLMFANTQETKVIRLTHAPVNKIACIKVLRYLSHLGLKETKDRVELPIGEPLIIFSSIKDAGMAMDMFRSNSVHCVMMNSASSTEMYDTSIPHYKKLT